MPRRQGVADQPLDCIAGPRLATCDVEGRSPLAIVKELNREGVPAPRGGSWSASTLNGSRQRENGILSNSLYIGRLTYNRQHFVKDPANGRRQARKNDRSQWMTAEIPELAIIDTKTWEATQARRRTINCAPLTQRRGPKRLLSGLLKCGVCGASFIIVTKDHVACSAYRNKRTCDNKRTMRMGEIEQRVLTALKRHLLTPDAVTTAVEAYRVERQRLSRARARDRSALEREISEAGRQIDRMIASIKDGVDPKLLVAELNNAQAKREALERQLRLADSPDVAVLHPQAAAAYRQKVVHIQEALARGDAAALEAVTLVRGLVHEIRVTPGPDRMELQVVGDLAALLEQEQGGNKRDFIGGCGGSIWAMPYTNRVHDGRIEPSPCPISAPVAENGHDGHRGWPATVAREPRHRRPTQSVGAFQPTAMRGCEIEHSAQSWSLLSVSSLQSHCRGQGFDSPRLHQLNQSFMLARPVSTLRLATRLTHRCNAGAPRSYVATPPRTPRGESRGTHRVLLNREPLRPDRRHDGEVVSVAAELTIGPLSPITARPPVWRRPRIEREILR